MRARAIAGSNSSSINCKYFRETVLLSKISDEHRLNRLVFDGVSKFMDTVDLPEQARTDQVTPLPYMCKVGDTAIAFISLLRRTRDDGGVGLVIQYTVKIGEKIIASLARNSRDPLYGMLRFRREHLAEDLEQLTNTFTSPMDFREMTREEAETFVAEDKSLARRQIRVTPR
jgi:hypothetical protein